MSNQQQATQAAPEPRIESVTEGDRSIKYDAAPYEAPGTKNADKMAEMAANLAFAKDFAQALKGASVVPEHLRTRRLNGKVIDLSPQEVEANLVLVCNQALRWDVDPFSLLGETYVVGGKLGYQGKLVAAVINRELSKRLQPSYEYPDDGDIVATITGTIRGEPTAKSVDISFNQACTRDRDSGQPTDQWSRDPEQKLFYSGATKWARRNLPEVLMGILVEEEAITTEDSPAQGTDLVESTSTNAGAVAVLEYRTTEAKHRGHLERIVEDANTSRLQPAEKELVLAGCRKIYKDLPTAEDYHKLDEVQLRDRPEGMTEGSTQASRAATKPKATKPKSTKPKSSKKGKVPAKQEAPAQEFDEGGLPASTTSSGAGMVRDGYLEGIAVATQAAQVKDIVERAKADPRMTEATFQEVQNAADEALS